MADISVEVVLATVLEQAVVSLQVPEGTTATHAVALAGLAARFPELEVVNAPLGIFGRLLKNPAHHVLEEGDRVEVYRPLVVDPMEVRRMRAEKNPVQRRKGFTPKKSQ